MNRLVRFFSLENRLLYRWQVPVTAVILMVGFAATASTFKAAAPKAQKQALDSTSVAPLLPPDLAAVTPPPQEPAVDSTALAPNEAPSLEAASPEQQESAVDSTALAPNEAPSLEAASPEQQESAVDSTALALNEAAPVKAAAPKPQKRDVDSTAVASPSAKWNRQAQLDSKAIIAQAPSQDASIPDGTYLYGQSSQPQQIGKEYLVFQAHQGKVVGAMYLPNSEYSCFHGTLDSMQMNMTVVNSYDQTAFSHTIARAHPAQLAAAGGQINLENTYDSLSYPYTVALEGYQPLNQVSAQDEKILNTCVSELSGVQNQ